MTTLLTFGTYDAPHAGHAGFLRRCERFTDRVVVGVRSDAMVERLKGHPPLWRFWERAAVLRDLGYEVRESTECGRRLVNDVRPDVLAIGSDWARRDWLGRIGLNQDTLDEKRITLIYVPYTPHISTTEIKRRLARHRAEVPA